jgi:IPT/TIG domain-containing protein/PASTA domain-containing protein
VLLETAQTSLAALAWYGILRAALPRAKPSYRLVLAAYAVAVALNGFLPANLGTLVMLMMFTALIADRLVLAGAGHLEESLAGGVFEDRHSCLHRDAHIREGRNIERGPCLRVEAGLGNRRGAPSAQPTRRQWMRYRQRHKANLDADSGGKPGRSGRVGLVAIVAASACALFATTAAQAATVTVGSVLPVTFTSSPFGQVETQLNTALPERGANLVSPVNGAIVRWRVLGAKGGPFYLRVLHPNGSGAYTATGTSLPATPSGTGLQTFSTNMPIHTGDLIGIDPTNASDEIGVASVPGASSAFIFPPPFDGSTVAPSGATSGQEIELNAEVQPAPEITSIVPASGSVAGGTTVTITGTNLNAASAVKFGTTPAASFTVDSETQITAVTPPSTTASTVDVIATTLAGTSPVVKTDHFTYTGCVVPKLKGKTLKASKQSLRRANCKLGKVKGDQGKSATVTKQSPKPRKVLVPGSKVSVTLHQK